MKKEPIQISQIGAGQLFCKLPTDLYSMQNSCFVGHRHRETVLFRKSITEQRDRYYGTTDFSRIVYQQARIARDPPSFISGDETITRMYGRKATDIRMRTSKKNESGILNQIFAATTMDTNFERKGIQKVDIPSQILSTQEVVMLLEATVEKRTWGTGCS